MFINFIFLENNINFTIILKMFKYHSLFFYKYRKRCNINKQFYEKGFKR